MSSARRILATTVAVGLLLASASACSDVLGIEDATGTPMPGTSAHGAEPVREDGGASSTAGDGATCTADVASDPENCGTCGHSCAGGACDRGRCQPLDIGFGTRLSLLRARAGSVFWHSDGNIARCFGPACSDGARTFISVSEPIGDFEIAADTLFLSSSTRVQAIDRDTGTKRTDLVNGAEANGLALAYGDALYALTKDTPAKLLRCSDSACEQRATIPGTGSPAEILADGSDVIVVMHERSPIASAYYCNASGCRAEPVAELSNGIGSYAVALHGKRLAWVAMVDGTATLRTCTLPACSDKKTLAAGPLYAIALIALDEAHVYVSEYATRLIRRCALTGCPNGEEAVFDGMAGFAPLVSDGPFLYWIDLDHMSVRRLAK